MSPFRRKAVSFGMGLSLALSLVGSAFAESPVVSKSQTGTNTTIVAQSLSARSGNAIAGPGATAKSGSVEVKAEAKVSQTIHQTSGSDESATEVTSNTANVTQVVAAKSGDAVAVGPKSEAKSGDVKVVAEANASTPGPQIVHVESKPAIADPGKSEHTDPVTVIVPPTSTGSGAGHSSPWWMSGHR